MARLPCRNTLIRFAALALASGAVVVGSYLGYTSWRFEAEFQRASREAAVGSFASARDRLARLASRRPGRDDVEYTLGACEATLGRVDAALGAWARVPENSPFADRAALYAARVALEHGRLSHANQRLDRLVGRDGPVGHDAAKLADQLDLYLGRERRITDRIERRWAFSDGQAARLRTHWMLQTQPFPVEGVGEALGRMSRESPDDPLVWLGNASLALRTGRIGEADAWLSRCEKQRPADGDVAELRLKWALAANDPGAARRAASVLKGDRFTPAETAELAARIGASRHDTDAERKALERRVELEPGDSSAWTRLADIAAAEGRTGAMAAARRKKAEIDRLMNEYRTLMGAVVAGDSSRYGDLARTAEALGRRFEARGWWSLLARRSDGGREAREGLARLAPRTPTAPATSGKTLADLFDTGSPVSVHGDTGATPKVPRFLDVAGPAGLNFVYENDRTPDCRLPETMGGGVALIDLDGDGFLDVYAVQGGRFPGGLGGPDGGDRLFRNTGDGAFEDVTERAGVAAMPRAFGHGVSVGDFDNDGRPDLFVTRWRSYALLRNRGDGTLEDVTERAGLGGSRGWPTSSAFADLDGDGDLDLYVCHYLDWSPERSPRCPDAETPGVFRYCVPRSFPSEPDHVFRNDGGRFVDVTEAAGVVDRDGRGLGVVAADLDGDGRVDLYVANDMSANFLFRNLGGFRFEEVGEASGAASNGDGGYQAGMGVACGDLDGDGRPDLAVTNFYGESTTLFQNLGGGLFADRTSAAGLSAPSRFVLGFGASFLDANNDGLLDLATANGHVNDYRPAVPYAMPSQLYLGTGSGRLLDVSQRAGPCWSTPRVGRGLAVGDLDNDGRLDLVILSQASPLAFFRNVDAGGGRSLTLRLEGTTSNRDGVGASVRVISAGRTVSSQRLGGGSFLSASDGRLHFGLGGGDGPVSVEVRWPGGRIDRVDGLRPDGGYLVVEGGQGATPLKGWKGRSVRP